jgi:hypothetical protein
MEGISTIKTAWPMLEKSLVSVLLTKSGKLFSVVYAGKVLQLIRSEIKYTLHYQCAAVKAEF